MPAPEIIIQLVEKFEMNRDAYRSGRYNEAQLRQEFLDPFFEALGWDVYNKNGYSLEYRDVVIEESLEIGEHEQGAGLRLQDRQGAQVLRGSQEAGRGYPVRHPPGLPAAALRLERPPAPERADRFRRVRHLQLQEQARPEGQRRHRAG